MKKIKLFSWRDYFEVIVIALVLSLIVRNFIVSAFVIPTESMAPTLIPGDYVFAYKAPFVFNSSIFESKWGVHLPEQNDVVVFRFLDQPNTYYIKRVIGLPGDKIEIKNNEIWVNEKVLKKIDDKIKDFGPIVVSPDNVFLLGDSLKTSDDSRYWGTVPSNLIEGKVFSIWLSIAAPDEGNQRSVRVRWNRMFKGL